MDSHCLKSVGVGPVTRLGSWKRLDMSWSRGRGESVSACVYNLSRSAYCLLPTACCLLLLPAAIITTARLLLGYYYYDQEVKLYV
jgi:hypothetical protein